MEAGADVHKVFELVFESMPFGKLLLLGRVIANAVSYQDGRLLISHVTASRPASWPRATRPPPRA